MKSDHRAGGNSDERSAPPPGQQNQQNHQNHQNHVVSGGGGTSHPLSSANPPGLPRPPLHPLQHTHGHSHLIGGHQANHNGSPMQRLQGGGLGHHGPAPPPPIHISNPPTSSSHHPMTTLASNQSVQHGPGGGPPSQTLVSNGGHTLNGHTNHPHQASQLFGDTEPDNEKWWWVCCLEFCFCLL